MANISQNHTINTKYRYILAPYRLFGRNQKILCPKCGKRTFVPYVDAMTLEILEGFGRCDREIKCGYHRKPSGIEQNIKRHPLPRVEAVEITAEPITELYLNFPDLSENNPFFLFLCNCFPIEKVRQVLRAYLVKEHNSFVLFPQICSDGAIYDAKGIKYQIDGHRDKRVAPLWVHTILKKGIANRCYFGTHLIDGGRVYVVESEKTAIICACYFEASNFVATGGLTLANRDKLSMLSSEVVLIPDSDGIWRWKFLGFPMFDIENFAKSVLATSLPKGYDIADVIVQHLKESK